MKTNRLLTLIVCLFLTYLPLSAQSQVSVRKAGTLGTVLTPLQQDTCTSLSVKGRLNSDDIRVLRRMAGADGGKGKLKVLDLKQATFVRDNRPYLVLDVDRCPMDVYLSISGTRSRNDKSRNPARSINSPSGLMDTESLPPSYPHVDTKQYLYKVSEIRLNQEPKVDGQHPDAGTSFRCLVYGVATDFKFLNKADVAYGPGYAFVREDGRNLFKVKLQKNTISDAMFYGTKTLQAVILPGRMTYDALVKIQGYGVHFFRGTEQEHEH